MGLSRDPSIGPDRGGLLLAVGSWGSCFSDVVSVAGLWVALGFLSSSYVALVGPLGSCGPCQNHMRSLHLLLALYIL